MFFDQPINYDLTLLYREEKSDKVNIVSLIYVLWHLLHI